MNKTLVLGAEAIAQAAIDEGISGVYAYPGTPSTEITEYIQNSKEAQEKNIRSTWAANEKTAYEAALGMSFAGKRSLVCMKHVGLNVAADAFINSALTGVNGGLVVLVADDPSMHSSQNEQDTRFYGKFSYLSVLEPATQQEAYDCVRYAFNYSEETQLPVIVRITTRLSHSRSAITLTAKSEQNKLNPDKQKGKWILLPAIARKRYENLLDLQSTLIEASESSKFNKVEECEGKTGIIAFGIAYNYTKEVLSANNASMPILKVCQYPLPTKMIKEFCDKHDSIIVAEEGYPIYEELLHGFFGNSKIKGRLDGTLPRVGELSPDAMAKVLGFKVTVGDAIPEIVENRPPELCKGCSHRDVYTELNKILEEYDNKYVFADIGCYTLGALPPYQTISTCVDMGASITMAKGASDAGLHPAVAIIGDSTFTHSGITGLLDAVNDKNAVTILISDNYTTGMTGGQDSAGTGKLKDICLGVGVEEEHIRILNPLPKFLEENVKVMREEFEYKGVSVIISQRECIQTLRRKK